MLWLCYNPVLVFKIILRYFITIINYLSTMGAHMTKGLGLYNEEEQICTPLGTPVEPQQYRRLHSDPRSVTRGIMRTPIQVLCTPTGVKTKQQKENLADMDCSLIDNSRQEELNVNDSKEQTQHTEIEVEEVQLNTPSHKPLIRYLETDIDRINSPPSESTPIKTERICTSKPEQVIKPLIALGDVRSPSLQTSRTPILVQCTPELFALHSRIDSISFCDFDAHTDDPSATVSDDEQASLHRSTVNNWLDDVDNAPVSDSPCNISFTDSPKTVAKKQKEINAMRKQLFFTPDINELTKPKARTPLGDIQARQFQDSPAKLMKSKQWKNIQDERKRLGIHDTENTPPSLPPLLKPASAPGKILNRNNKRSKSLWDDENTMMI